MAVTLRNDAKHQIIKILQEEGYPTYARLANLFDIYLTDDPNVVGYMIPSKAKIVINKDLSITQVSLIIRHEILHEWLTHWVRKDRFEKENSKHGNHDLANIAADLEISNRGYTDADKGTARSIKLGDKVVQGLVTEYDMPGWEDKSFEEIYAELLKKEEESQEQLKDLLKQLQSISQKELDDLEDDISQAQQQNSQSSNNGNMKKSRGEGSPEDSENGTTAGSTKDGRNEDPSADKELSRLKQATNQIQQEVNNQGGGDEEGEPLATDSEQQRKIDIAARAEQIRKELDNIETKAAIEREVSDKKRADKIKKAQQQHRYAMGKSSGGLSNFKLDLRRFIASQVREDEKDDSWEIFNPSYDGSGFMMPGKRAHDNRNVPVINVYWDTSGSFNDPKKTAGARAAIDTLDGYVKKGLIQINVYYHSSEVYTTPHGGGNDGNAVMEHIKATKPTNVIIITDGDLSDTSIQAQVPGAVWMLFYDSTSSGLIRNLKGKKQSKYYMIDYK